MIKININELFWFQLLNRCPVCKNKHLTRIGYDNIGIHFRKCSKCGWGEYER